jgi:hypothetical protein
MASRVGQAVAVRAEISLDGREVDAQPIWQPGHSPCAVNAGDCATRVDQKRFAAVHLVLMFDPGSLGPNRSHTNAQHIVKFRGKVVPAMHFGHDEQNATGFELLVTDPGSAEHFNARKLKPGQVIGVMHTPLTVGFLITHPNLNLVLDQHAADCKRRVESAEG